MAEVAKLPVHRIVLDRCNGISLPAMSPQRLMLCQRQALLDLRFHRLIDLLIDQSVGRPQLHGRQKHRAYRLL